VAGAAFGRVLALDVGAGTTDVLLWDRAARGENQTHFVIPSATRVVAAEIAAATAAGRAVVFSGPSMGGGASSGALDRHLARGLAFYAEPAAAKSFADDLDRVAAMGVTLVSEDEAARLRSGHVAVRSGDVRLDDLLAALRLLGETRPLDGLAVAVQDHGEAPLGTSDRVFRFEKMARALAQSRRLADFFYAADGVPPYFTRLAAVAGSLAGEYPVVVGDTGPSALWGASLAAGGRTCLAINFGNGHSLMSRVEDEELDGLFEHHTSQLTPGTMADYVRRFAARSLPDAEVFAGGGHGVVPVSSPFDLAAIEVVVTGPNRGRFPALGVPALEAGLYGDMMLTGCWGLLKGFFARLDPEGAASGPC
jgi:uncharacterized protein (DUF1786 family)